MLLCLGYPGYPGPMGLPGPKGEKGECQGKHNFQPSNSLKYIVIKVWKHTSTQNCTFPSNFFPKKKLYAWTQFILMRHIQFLCNKKTKNINPTYSY